MRGILRLCYKFRFYILVVFFASPWPNLIPRVLSPGLWAEIRPWSSRFHESWRVILKRDYYYYTCKSSPVGKIWASKYGKVMQNRFEWSSGQHVNMVNLYCEANGKTVGPSGIWTHTFGIPVRRSTDWAIEPNGEILYYPHR